MLYNRIWYETNVSNFTHFLINLLVSSNFSLCNVRLCFQIDPTKARGWIQELLKGKQFLLLIRHSPCDLYMKHFLVQNRIKQQYLYMLITLRYSPLNNLQTFERIFLKQELFTLQELLDSSPGFGGIRVAHLFSFLCKGQLINT
jgi:hypothetical protein